MAKYDVVVIGAGAAGLSAGAILAKQGKKVLVMDRDAYLGGRGMAIPYEGYRLNLGGHLLEDSGSGITKIIEYIGGKLEHGPTSKGMPVWVGDRWKPVQELYNTDKSELKKIIQILTDIDFKEFDNYDDVPLRTWLRKYTTSEGVIALFEYITAAEAMTEHWYDHVASDNLYVRKMHYMEKRMAGYSFWPVGGWDGMFQQMADGVTRHGGEIWMQTTAQKLLIENGRVVGVACEKGPRAIPNEAYNWEVVETECVISTLPVWNVLNFVREEDLPDWYVAQIKMLAQDQFRACWLGVYAATREPVYTGIHPTEWRCGSARRTASWAASPFWARATTRRSRRRACTCSTAASSTRACAVRSGWSSTSIWWNRTLRPSIPAPGRTRTSSGRSGTWWLSRPSA